MTRRLDTEVIEKLAVPRGMTSRLRLIYAQSESVAAVLPTGYSRLQHHPPGCRPGSPPAGHRGTPRRARVRARPRTSHTRTSNEIVRPCRTAWIDRSPRSRSALWAASAVRRGQEPLPPGLRVTPIKLATGTLQSGQPGANWPEGAGDRVRRGRENEAGVSLPESDRNFRPETGNPFPPPRSQRRRECPSSPVSPRWWASVRSRHRCLEFHRFQLEFGSVERHSAVF